jgi:hypothetical protein
MEGHVPIESVTPRGEITAIPMPHETYPALLRKRMWLGRLRHHHIELVLRFLRAGGGDIFPTDLFFLGVLNRSYHLMDAFLNAFDHWNVYVAAPLVRLQIDNLVRVSYVARSGRPHDFAMRLVRGEEFRRIIHDDGKPLTDGKLVQLASPFHEWIKPVYEEASGWIHLSPLHFTGHLGLDEAAQTLQMEFPLGRERIPARFLAEVQGAMAQATEELFGYTEVWEHRKDHPVET